IVVSKTKHARNYISERFRVISTVTWSKNLSKPYANDPQQKANIEQMVIDHAKNNGIEARGAESVIIKSTAHRGGTSPGAPSHVTAEFKAPDGAHITTQHVPV
ncbi:hypothetical protein DEU56DRAFT_959036, partial [Suillus clintonianus]|uniref:uncharacterized protein n=1 Tax=Suillus clintonianus TaxID=1904413 RepID=UPI001B86C0FF